MIALSISLLAAWELLIWIDPRPRTLGDRYVDMWIALGLGIGWIALLIAAATEHLH